MLKKAIIFCATILVTLTMNSRAQQNQPDSRSFLMPGYILMVPLSEFAPARMEKSCDLLINYQYNEATVLLKQEIAQHNNNLAAYLGLAQADPSLWQSDIKKLEDEVKINAADPIIRFKLGALHFYHAKVQYSTHGNLSADKELTHAKALLSQSWHNLQNPLVGLLYAEANQMPSPNLQETSKVIDQLIKILGGSKTYASYQEAKRASWQASPPSLQGIPSTNLKPLRGVIRLAKSLSSV